MVYSRPKVSGAFLTSRRREPISTVMEEVKQVWLCFQLNRHEHLLQVALRPKVFVRQAIARALISSREFLDMSLYQCPFYM